MKLRPFTLSLLAGASLVLPTHADPDVHLIQNAAEAAPAGLAAKVGFAAHLPKNTEGYLSIMGAWDLYERFGETAIGKLMMEMMAAQGADLDSLEEDPEFAMVKSIIGEELFLAFGDTAGEQAVNLNAISSSYSRNSMKMVVKMMELSLSPDPDFSKMESVMMGLFKDTLNDPKAGLEVFKKTKMPPVTVGFKVSDEEMRNQIFDMMSGGVLMLAADEDAPVDEIDEKKDGVDLTGVRISGKKLAAFARAEGDDEALQMFGSAAMLENYLKALEGKNLNIVVAQKGPYIVAYVGDSLESLSFPATPAESLAGNAGMDFLTKYADKDIRMLLFGEEEAFKTMTPSTDVVGSMAKGLQEGLADSEFFGDTRDVQALLGHVARLEKTLVGMVDYTRLGGVGYLEDGFKIEIHGGSNHPTIDTKTPHAFSALGEMEDVVFFSNTRSNPEFNSKLYDMLSSLGEAAYLMASRASTMEGEDRDLQEFGEGFKMFDQMFAKDLKAIWEALTVDWAAGTGNEGALVVDTKGTMPNVPEVPGVVIEKGLIPRIAYVTPVTDRTKVSAAWKKIEGSLKNLLKTTKEMGGPEIPMQAIDDKTEDGVTYYWTGIPFTTPDTRPVVGLSDKHFFLSTSPKFIGEINKRMGTPGPVRSGSYTKVSFKAAGDFAKYWVKLMKDNADDIFQNEFERDDFKANLPVIEKFLAAFGEFEEFTSHLRAEGGVTRSSIHFKMK